MRTSCAFLLVGLAGCSTATSAELGAKGAVRVTVEMTAATLADDCPDETAPSPPQAPPDADVNAGARVADQSMAEESSAKRSCEQTSMQLSVIASATGDATELKVKKVELYDKGKLVGTLTPRSPRVWSEDGSYKAWDEKIAAGQKLSVTYALSAPSLAASMKDKTYVLKAVVTAGGSDRTVKRDIKVYAPAIMRPDVVT